MRKALHLGWRSGKGPAVPSYPNQILSLGASLHHLHRTFCFRIKLLSSLSSSTSVFVTICFTTWSYFRIAHSAVWKLRWIFGSRNSLSNIFIQLSSFVIGCCVFFYCYLRHLQLFQSCFKPSQLFYTDQCVLIWWTSRVWSCQKYHDASFFCISQTSLVFPIYVYEGVQLCCAIALIWQDKAIWVSSQVDGDDEVRWWGGNDNAWSHRVTCWEVQVPLFEHTGWSSYLTSRQNLCKCTFT